MKNNPFASGAWLSNLPDPYANYLSCKQIALGRHPSAFLVYKDEVKFVKQVPKDMQGIEYSVLSWLAQLQVKHEALSRAPVELLLPKPDLLLTRPDLLVTSKLMGKNLSKVSLLTHLTLLNKAIVYIHDLVKTTNLPNKIAQAVTNELPIKINDVDPSFREQFIKAEMAISESHSLLAFIHGDLSSGNILLNGNTHIGLVDWEYATVRDCRWDLATLGIEFELNADEFETLCKNYIEQRGLTNETEFIQIAKSWLVIYSITCLSWAKEYDQDTNRYIQFLQQVKN